jgi:hypothetical protein
MSRPVLERGSEYLQSDLETLKKRGIRNNLSPGTAITNEL